MNEDIDSSDEDAESAGCALVGDLSSQSSLNSDIPAEYDEVSNPNDDIAEVAIDLSCLEPPSTSSDIHKFWSMVPNSPLYKTLVDFRDKHKNEKSMKRLENPSARAATDRALAMRVEFSNLVQESGTSEQREAWLALNTEQCDEFLCQVFLPKEVGGFF